MPIKNLTDRAARFPKLGNIRKGEPRPEHGKAPGKDTDYFRLDTPDEQLKQDWKELYGEKPQSLPIVLPYHTTEENLASWMEEWKASSLIRRCDGENQHLRLEGNRYNNSFTPCIAPNCQCKPSGKLIVVLPGLKRLGYLELQTHSKWDLIGLSENLQAFELSIGSLQGIPLILTRREQEISAPKGESDRMRIKKWLLHLEINPQYSARLLESFTNRSLRSIEDMVPALQPSSDSWQERGIAWAILQGLEKSIALELIKKVSSKREYFACVKAQLDSLQSEAFSANDDDKF